MNDLLGLKSLPVSLLDVIFTPFGGGVNMYYGEAYTTTLNSKKCTLG